MSTPDYDFSVYDTENKKTFFQRFKKSIIFIIVLGLSGLAFANWIGFQHIPHHVENLWHEITSLSGSKDNVGDYATGAQIAGSGTDQSPMTEEAEPAPTYPTDTMDLKQKISRLQQNKPGIEEQISQLNVAEQLRETERELKYLRRDFPKLTAAQEKPTSEQVQEALIRRYGDEMITLLQENKAHIEVGKCFNAERQTSESGAVEAARVTCMVSAFTKEHKNLGNIELPLNIVYDFARFEGEAEWKVTDISQTIPFDYQLNPRSKDEE